MSDDQGEELRYCPACCGPLDGGTVCEERDCMDEIKGTETQHTPGPWGVSGRTVRACRTDATAREWLRSAPVACAYSEDDNDGEWPTDHDDDVLEFPTNEVAYANARLIAAAPDLLAALRELVTLWDSPEPFTGADALQAIGEATERARAAIRKAEGE